MLPFASRRIIESPMFYVALPALHHCAPHARLPTLSISRGVALRKVQVRIGHAQLFSNTAEAQFAIRFFKRKRVRRRRLFALQKPLVHPPEMGGFDVQPKA